LTRVRFIFKTTSIRDTKTAAMIEPATLLSVEPSAFQNQIAKRNSATRSITARREYGVDILDGSILVLLGLILAKLVSPFKSREQGSRGNRLITLVPDVWSGLSRGKIFLGSEESGVRIFWRPYLCRILVVMERIVSAKLFCNLFCGVFSGLGNVLWGTFSLSGLGGIVPYGNWRGRF
jgi:hypothetical protein